MAKTTFAQSNFLGGEWGVASQGRFDLETYRGAMNVCFNGYPIEAGAWVRRPGTVAGGYTRQGNPGILRDFHFSQNLPYTAEFTNGVLRFWAGNSLALDNAPVAVVSISTADPALMTTQSATTWVTGDEIVLHQDTNVNAPGLAILFNRTLRVVKNTTTTFYLYDPVLDNGNLGIDGSTLTGATGGLYATRVLAFATPYSGQGILDNLRLIQSEQNAVLLTQTVPPGLITVTGEQTDTNYASFTYQQTPNPSFVDGPYLPWPSAADGSYLTPSGSSGTITLLASSASWINGGAGFQTTDVGRLMRLLSEPPAWDSGTSYAVGQSVKYAGTYWTAQVAQSDNIPGADAVNWFLNPYAAAWTWGTIASVVSGTSVTLTLAAADPNMVLAGGDLLNPGVTISTWQLGVYSNTTGWPTGGTYSGGRFWLFGVITNRFDGSYADDPNPFNFAPTDLYGNVLDASGVYEYALADDTNTIFWMVPIHDNAIVVGTQAGEFLLQASNLGDPITATSIQCHRVTKYKCADIEPRWTGLSLAMVQSAQRNVLEYVSDVYSRKMTAANLNEHSRHMTASLVQEIAYQYDLTPIIWSRTGDGNFIGTTYKRESPFGTQPAKFNGWHRHALGSGRDVLSIQSGPDPNGIYDTLALLTQDPVTNICYVEFLSKTFDETDTIYDANEVDSGAIPTSAQYVVGTPDTVVLYGLQSLAGDTITVWGAGLDLGDYTVSAGGTVTLTVGEASLLFTSAVMAAISATGISYGTLGVNVASATGYAANFQAISLLQSTTGAVSMPVMWDQNIGIAMTGGTGMKTIDLTTGAVINSLADSNVSVLANFGAIDVNGNVYYTDGGSNSSPIYQQKVNTDGSFGAVTKFGGSSGNFEYVSAGFTVIGHMQQPYAMSCGQAIIDKKVRNYMLTTTLVSTSSSGARIGLVDTDNLNYTGFSFNNIVDMTSSATSTRINLSRGITVPIPGKNASNCIWYGAAFNYTSGGLGGLDIYKFEVSQADAGGPLFTSALLSTIAPATIASDWTSVDVAAGVGYDEADGNLIVSVATATGTPAHTAYMMKIGAASGEIIWKLSAGGTSPALQGVGDQHFYQFSRFRGGRIDLVVTNGDSFGATIDTIAGTVLATTTMTGFGVTGSTVANGASGVVAARGNFTDPGAGYYPRGTPNFSNEWGVFEGANGFAPPPGNYYVPFAVGFNFISQGQILRTVIPQEAGSQIGPALAVKRRTHNLGILVQNTQGLQIGTTFDDLQPCDFRDASDNPDTWALSALAADGSAQSGGLFTGVHWDNIDDSDSFDSMLCWEINRPYPATIVALQGFQTSKPV